MHTAIFPIGARLTSDGGDQGSTGDRAGLVGVQEEVQEEGEGGVGSWGSIEAVVAWKGVWMVRREGQTSLGESCPWWRDDWEQGWGWGG